MQREKPAMKLAARILRKYRVLQGLLQSLADLTSKTSPPTAETAQGLERLLRSLRSHLARHFELEEEGELFDDILARLPMCLSKGLKCSAWVVCLP